MSGKHLLLAAFILLPIPLGGACHSSHFPADVPTNGTLELDDCDANVKGTAINVGLNGTLTLHHCHLKSGDVVIKAGTNARIDIVDSTLEGAKAVIETEYPNVVITIENSTLTSGGAIAVAPMNLKLSATGN